MEKKLLAAVVLSIVVMLVYPFFLAKVSPPIQTELPTMPQERDRPEPYVERQEEEPLEPTLLPLSAQSKALHTNRYALTVTNIGGSIQAVSVTDSKRLDMDLVEGAIYQAGILSMEGKDSLEGLSSQPFELKEDTNTMQAFKQGLLIEKKIRFVRDKYALEASISITNKSDSVKPLSFEVTTASNISNKELYESRYIEAIALYKDGKLKKLAGANSKKYNKLYHNNIEWLALKNKYYSIIARPDFVPAGIFTRQIRGVPVIGFIVDDQRLFPGETKAYNFIVYIGPTDINELEKVDKQFGRALNFGIFTSISLILLGILKFFYSLFHNYGVSILFLTCCISLLLFPLTFKSLRSMRKLQELQPHIEKVRLAHKDNPHKLNKEIMEVYRRYNVNPMGGCLPIFFQMPVFIALYQTLMRSVELKGANFLWIKDLSLPDAAFHLPFTLPFFGSAINLLPILMIGAMIIQQKMSSMRTSASQTEQQKMMGSIMPVVFGLIFYSLPSGLVLYWLTNTILTSSLQFVFLRKA